MPLSSSAALDGKVNASATSLSLGTKPVLIWVQ